MKSTKRPYIVAIGRVDICTSDIVMGGGNYIFYVKPIVDSGPGSPSDRTLSS